MNVQEFMDRLLRTAGENGIDPAEIYYTDADSFSANAQDTEIDSYEVSSSCSLSIRGSVNGKMGYASTEAFDEEALAYLIRAVKESAALNEAEEQDEIYAGTKAIRRLRRRRMT